MNQGIWKFYSVTFGGDENKYPFQELYQDKNLGISLVHKSN